MQAISNKVDLSIEKELEYVYYARLDNKYFHVRDVVERLVEYMHNRSYVDLSNKFDVTKKIIENLNGAFLKFFYVNTRVDRFSGFDEELKKDKDPRSNEEDREKPRLDIKAIKKVIKGDEKKDLSSFEMVESAEFTQAISEDDLINDERIESNLKPSTKRSNEKIKQMITSRFGASIVSDYRASRIEKNICTGIHKGIKLHFTDGSFKGDVNDRYYMSIIENQRSKNLEYYKDNELIFRRATNELREIVKKRVLQENQDDSYISDSGNIIVNKIWRNKYLGDNKIFLRDNKLESGSISVDILLDSSASQNDREELVSCQAYIIAEALTSLNIPTRVTGFCNFFNYAIIKKYRDYNDSPLVNKRIFDYKGMGSNRDGLLIKLLSSEMDALEAENRVLIILSDGKPNDKINLGTKGFFEVDGRDYVDREAVYDTASEVFNLKLGGKFALGVFTGDDEDIESEKIIYGRDFAYIKRIERFSQIIGFYLEQLLK